ncbi:MAG TPA: hypothetical protein VK116_18375 [Planctomycetota bacterium]|nr:hypothetical protein [Planctomycetota bacterium]
MTPHDASVFELIDDGGDSAFVAEMSDVLKEPDFEIGARDLGKCLAEGAKKLFAIVDSPDRLDELGFFRGSSACVHAPARDERDGEGADEEAELRRARKSPAEIAVLRIFRELLRIEARGFLDLERERRIDFGPSRSGRWRRRRGEEIFILVVDLLAEEIRSVDFGFELFAEVFD